MARAAVVLALVAAGCPADDGGGGGSGAGEDEGSTATAASSGGAGPGSTTNLCDEDTLPLCFYCPAEEGLLCGLACPLELEGATCSNEAGDRAVCEGGLWACSLEPPMGAGCNAVCRASAVGCTSAGCIEGLVFTISAAGFGAGTWGVDLVLDGVALSCTFEVADLGCDGDNPCVTGGDCDAVFDVAGDSPSVQMTLPVVGQFSATVTRDATTLGETTQMPAYAVIAPNGVGCQPACANAMVELSVGG